MKRKLKIASALFIVILSASCIASCVTSCFAPRVASYRDDVGTDSILEAIEKKIPLPDGYSVMDDDYLDFNFEGIKDEITEHGIEISAVGSNINQFGVFRAKNGRAKEVKRICDAYLEKTAENWLKQINYTPNEHPKMENAECRIFGNYVIYAILSRDDKKAVFGLAEELLKTAD